ncbi:hypothetical protein M0804_008562 [Polistes exclamans]|nr:hypothetical protein M0804_008562 [Polistes exclamans]
MHATTSNLLRHADLANDANNSKVILDDSAVLKRTRRSMIDIKESNKEDEELLLPDIGTKKFNKYSELNLETVIMKGVVKQLEKWPSYLFFVFFIGCIIMVNLVLLVIATATFSLPTNTTNIINNRDKINSRSINVYSVKQEDRIWSMIDLCYIESAARENPELNINLINIYKEKPKENTKQDVLVTKKFEPEIITVTNTNKKSRSLKIMLEARLRDELVCKYENINTQNIIVDNFFQGKENEKCVLDALATIDPQNDIQAAGVPCQVFLGYFINEISKNDSIHKGEALLKSINSFCPRTHSCNEIRILKDVKTCTLNSSKCPIVYNYLLPHL